MIGIFDSGLGGLTVLKALHQRFPKESFLYLGDTARLPYGNKSPETIARYVDKNLEFLVKQGVKAIIVACNSASSVVDETTRCQVPLFEVIGPGSAWAAQTSKNKKIGVIATRATVQREAYVKALHRLDAQIEVHQVACPLLVPLVEEGWTNDPLTNMVIFRYLSSLMKKGIDTLILGCTHYPLLKEAIAKVTGPHVNLVESSTAIADLLDHAYQSGQLPAPTATPEVQILTTDVNQDFKNVAERLMAPLTFTTVRQVDL